ncbi:MAG: restriction endonuclease [Xanthomonadales bacterium]|nr:restriction endonuclease [Xanthomonadales bacterium]
MARSEVQQFVGALLGRRARKGVLITTSTFTREARDDAAGLELRLALIDGPELARLMIAEGLGVRVEAEFPLRRLDAGYFAEEAAG